MAERRTLLAAAAMLPLMSAPVFAESPQSTTAIAQTSPFKVLLIRRSSGARSISRTRRLRRSIACSRLIRTTSMLWRYLLRSKPSAAIDRRRKQPSQS